MRNFAKIDLSAIKRNHIAVCGENKAICVVKADAYGHGAAKVANALDGDAYAFAVSSLDEALVLKNSGIKSPIMILGDGYPPEFDEAVKNGISVCVGSMKNAVLLDTAARKNGALASAVLCIDTGMHRDGFDAESTDIFDVFGLSNIKIEGVYSHPPRPLDAEFLSYQKAKIKSLKTELSRRGKTPFFSFESTDCAAFPEFIPRVGLGLYGFSEKTRNLTPTLELCAAILSKRVVLKGENVGYGLTFSASCDMIVATLSIGYGDGVPRALSNKGYVIINGKKAKICGSVCMDTLMADVTDIPCEVGDFATVMGKKESGAMTASVVADICETINYEILCGISKRVPRIYTEEQNETEIQMSDTRSR